jgi:outer membrane receptor protein involved in Fe transport
VRMWVRGAGAFALLVLSSARAQDTGSLTDLPIEQLLQVEVQSASRFRQSSIDAPAAVSVVTAEEIRTYGYRTLAEVISSMRGIYTSYDRYFTYVGVRGFSRPGDYNTRILLLIDGVRQNDAVFNQAMVGTEFPLDVDLIERVEFVPGAGSAMYGSNAFFGVLNVITKNGRDFRGGEVAGALGSYKTAKGRATYGSVDKDGTEWLVSVSSYHQHGQDLYFPAFGARADNLDGDRSNAFFAKLQTDNLSLSAIMSSRTKGNPAASYGQAFDAAGSQYTDEMAGINAEYRKALSDKLSMSMRMNFQQYQYRGDFIYDAPPRYTNRDRSDGSAWSGDVQFLSTHVRDHNIVFGMEHRHDVRIHQRNFDVSPYVSHLDSRTRGYTTGLFVQDEVTLSEQWLLNAGLRYDRAGGGSSESSTSPRLGLIYKPRPQTALKLLYGEAFRSPNAFERYYETATPGGSRRNPALRPETIKSTELVLEHAPTPSQRIIASAYRNDVSNLISQRYDGAADRFYFDNISGVRAKGYEFEWSARLRHGVQTRFSLGWQHAEDEMSGSRVENSPSRTFKANVSAPLMQDRLRAGLELQAMSERKSWRGAAPGFALVNLTVLAPHLARNVELSGSVYNLFDRRYFDPVGEELAPSDRVEQNGRNFRIKMTYRF